jgi:hypothetical protein
MRCIGLAVGANPIDLLTLCKLDRFIVAKDYSSALERSSLQNSAGKFSPQNSIGLTLGFVFTNDNFMSVGSALAYLHV